MSDQTNKKENHSKALAGKPLETLKDRLSGGWEVKDNQRLQRQFKFPDFKQALNFTNRVGEVAEQQGHHPDIFLTYGEVRLELSTHSAGGLTEADFQLADRVNELKQAA